MLKFSEIDWVDTVSEGAKLNRLTATAIREELEIKKTISFSLFIESSDGSRRWWKNLAAPKLRLLL